MVERGKLWNRAGHAIEQLRKLHSGERDMCILCYRGEDCSYRYLVSLLDELMIEDRTEIDVDKVRLVLAGSLARTWQCRNCGDDHGAGDGCDNPDFNPLGLYTIKDE